jgi:hypothetical protein
LSCFRDEIYPSWNCSFDVYEGAENNLPDQAAMDTAQRIQTMISKTMNVDDILLVLISGKVLHTKKTIYYYYYYYDLCFIRVQKKTVFIDRTWDLDFPNSRQNSVGHVHC